MAIYFCIWDIQEDLSSRPKTSRWISSRWRPVPPCDERASVFWKTTKHEGHKVHQGGFTILCPFFLRDLREAPWGLCALFLESCSPKF